MASAVYIIHVFYMNDITALAVLHGMHASGPAALHTAKPGNRRSGQHACVSATHGHPRLRARPWVAVGGDAALAPRPPPMVGGIPPCPRVVSRATLPGPVAASRWLYPPPSLLACLATTSLCHFLVLHRNLATALADVR